MKTATPGPTTGRWINNPALLASVVTLIAGVQLHHLLTWTPEALAASAVFRDDTYFYSVLARRFHESGVLTLDGVMATNGVQPLWMAVQIGLVKLFPGVHEVTLLARATWVAYLSFAFLGTWLVTALRPERAGLATTLFASTLLLSGRFERVAAWGLEAPAFLACLMGTLLLVGRVRRRREIGKDVSWGGVVGLALVSTLCFFGRTDFFWVTVVVGSWLMFRQRVGPAKLTVFAAVVGAMVLPYLWWNLTRFGGVMPLSGRVKKFYLSLHHPTFGSYLESDEWQGLPWALTDTFFPASVDIWIRLPIAVAMLVGGFLAVRWLARERDLPAEVVLLSVTVGLHAVFMYGVHRELRVSTFYYFLPLVLWFWLVFTLVTTRLVGRTVAGLRVGRLPVAVAALCVVASLVSAYKAIPRPVEYWSQRLALANDMRRLVPEGEAVGSFWPGLFAQFSARRVVPMDGIIGSRWYFDGYVRRNAQFLYLQEEGVRFLAVYLDEPLEAFFARPSFRPKSWNRLAQLRLWEVRDRVAEAVAVRPLTGVDGAWYLLRLDWGDRLPDRSAVPSPDSAASGP